MALNRAFWSGRKVFLTGHTGFKGGWLALWLRELGAEVYGYGLPPAAVPSLWQVAQIEPIMGGRYADIRDPAQVCHAIDDFKPELVFHLAAQPLVRESYRSPTDTYATNVMGTLNLLEAVRQCDAVRAVVVVTTDKCYDNREWVWPYREHDALGGRDPYSSSKACVELLCASYRESFLREAGVALATARAGNVLGGGDWSPDRLVPDTLRAWQQQKTVTLRHPHATRPWQHVLDPLKGYLLLAQALIEKGDPYASAWNFGPDADGIATVANVVGQLAEQWHGTADWTRCSSSQLHEAELLSLDSSKARQQLGWRPSWSLSVALTQTLAWHQAWQAGKDMQNFSRAQIAAYQGET